MPQGRVMIIDSTQHTANYSERIKKFLQGQYGEPIEEYEGYDNCSRSEVIDALSTMIFDYDYCDRIELLRDIQKSFSELYVESLEWYVKGWNST